MNAMQNDLQIICPWNNTPVSLFTKHSELRLSLVLLQCSIGFSSDNYKILNMSRLYQMSLHYQQSTFGLEIIIMKRNIR